MDRGTVQPADGLETIIESYGDMLYRICLITLNNEADAEDAVQETLIKWMTRVPRFQSAEHQKAWLIRVAVNQCRDMLRRRRKTVDIDTVSIPDALPQEQEAMDALLLLPEKFRTVLTLRYIMGYSVEEISRIIGKSSSAVKMRLKKGRTLLLDVIGRE